MGHYNTVKAGDPFRPSAKLENEVRKFFNGGATISGQSGKNSVANNNRIYVKNISEKNKIPAYSAVSITEKDGVFYADLAADANGFWGIAIETISPLSSGSVVVAGVVSAFISASGSGDFVAPGADGKLTRTSSGRGQLLYAGNAEKPGIILLGAGGGGGEKEYDGQFGIRFLGNRTFEVRYGRYNYAGSTDFGEVPVQIIVIPDTYIGDSTLRLYACRNDNKYSVIIQLSGLAYPQGYFDYVELGRCFANGTVYQYYTSYDRIDFGRRWFL